MLATGCPDPAAYDIRFQIVHRKDKFNGRVRITGIIKNIGNKKFYPYFCLRSGPWYLRKNLSV
jgi:hypothetical protein